jgi:hypothetical protein
MQKPDGPPPFSDAGGIGALMAGKSGWFDIELTPGNYIALCFVPSPTTGKAHFAMGMITPFSVAGARPRAGCPRPARLARRVCPFGC